MNPNQWRILCVINISSTETSITADADQWSLDSEESGSAEFSESCPRDSIFLFVSMVPARFLLQKCQFEGPSWPTISLKRSRWSSLFGRGTTRHSLFACHSSASRGEDSPDEMRLLLIGHQNLCTIWSDVTDPSNDWILPPVLWDWKDGRKQKLTVTSAQIWKKLETYNLCWNIKNFRIIQTNDQVRAFFMVSTYDLCKWSSKQYDRPVGNMKEWSTINFSSQMIDFEGCLQSYKFHYIDQSFIIQSFNSSGGANLHAFEVIMCWFKLNKNWEWSILIVGLW